MQIKNLYIQNSPLDQKKIDKVEKAEEKDRKSARVSESSDRVRISEEASLRNHAVGAARADSGMRSEKIAALKKQIAAGEYEPDNRKIAENIVKQDLDLLI